MFEKAIPLIIVGILNILIGILVLGRNPKKMVNVAFFGLSLFVGFWGIGIAFFYLVNDAVSALWWAKLYYIAPLLLVFFLTQFALNFPDRARNIWQFIVFLIPIAIYIASILLFDNFLIESVVVRDWGSEVLLDSLDYLAYSILIIVYFVIGLATIYSRYRNTTGLYREQARLFFVGGSISAFIGIIYNLILPWFGNYKLIWMGPLATSIFVGVVALSIVRHKMFDVRLIVARTLAYICTLGAIAILFGFGVLAVLSVFFEVTLSLSAQITLSAAAALAAVTFPVVKVFFDKTTRKIFYPDAYDARSFLDEFNNALLSNSDVEAVARSAANVIARNLHVEHVAIILGRTAYEAQRVIGSLESVAVFSSIDYETINQVGSLTGKDAVLVSQLEDTDAIMHASFSQNNVGLMSKLSSSIKHDIKGVGYLLIGNKNSGGAFTNDDLEIIKIISSELVIAIQNALRFEEIEKFNVTLQQKIDDATKELQKTNEKLRALDEAKDDFISMASHQLRTPLTSVKGYVSMLLEGDAGAINDQQRTFLNQAFASSQRMVYLIADLLNVSRLKTGKFIIENAPTYLPDVVETEVGQLYETAAARGLELHYEKPATFSTLNLDETKIRQVIMNFADNAIYYTPKGGHIDVNLTETENSVEFLVKDDGIGVPKTEQHHLFTKFYRAGNARRARPDGTGLGLFMAKKVIVAQGGSIIFRSEEGNGSTFGFSLPKAKLLVFNGD